MGACAFYHSWIQHYAHIAEPLYGFLKKGRKFIWDKEHAEVVRRLKEMLTTTLTLWKPVYKVGTPVYVKVDTSPTAIGWVVS